MWREVETMWPWMQKGVEEKALNIKVTAGVRALLSWYLLGWTGNTGSRSLVVPPKRRLLNYGRLGWFSGEEPAWHIRRPNLLVSLPIFPRVRLFSSPGPVQQQAWTGRDWRVFWVESINTPLRSGESGCPWCSCSGCWCSWWQRRGFGATRAKTLCVILDR